MLEVARISCLSVVSKEDLHEKNQGFHLIFQVASTLGFEEKKKQEKMQGWKGEGVCPQTHKPLHTQLAFSSRDSDTETESD